MTKRDGVDVIRDTAGRLCAHVEQEALTIRSDSAYLMLPSAGLVRCRSFLRSMIDHDASGLHDMTGVDLRHLFETFVFAEYILFGGAHARARLLSNELRHRSKMSMADAWDVDPSHIPTGTPKSTSFETMCGLVGDLMKERGSEQHEVFREAYEILYRGESYISAHPSLLGLGMYQREDDGSVRVELTRDSDIELRATRLLLGAMLLGHLAHDVFERAGLETSTVDGIGIALDELRQRPSGA